MISTAEVLQQIQAMHPEAAITEERLRRLIRTGRMRQPEILAGRYAWLPSDINRLQEALGLSTAGKETGHD